MDKLPQDVVEKLKLEEFPCEYKGGFNYKVKGHEIYLRNHSTSDTRIVVFDNSIICNLVEPIYKTIDGRKQRSGKLLYEFFCNVQFLKIITVLNKDTFTQQEGYEKPYHKHIGKIHYESSINNR